MKIADALRDRTALSALLDPADQRYVTGSPEDRKRARDEWHRHRYAAQVMRSDLEEIPRADLAPLRFGVVEDTRTGAFYRPRRDGLVDLEYANAIAYYVDAAGTPVLLERPPGPQNRAELEAAAGRTRAAPGRTEAAPRVDEAMSASRDKLWYLLHDHGRRGRRARHQARHPRHRDRRAATHPLRGNQREARTARNRHGELPAAAPASRVRAAVREPHPARRRRRSDRRRRQGKQARPRVPRVPSCPLVLRRGDRPRPAGAPAPLLRDGDHGAVTARRPG